jgi:hypothetical protein
LSLGERPDQSLARHFGEHRQEPEGPPRSLLLKVGVAITLA